MWNNASRSNWLKSSELKFWRCIIVVRSTLAGPADRRNRPTAQGRICTKPDCTGKATDLVDPTHVQLCVIYTSFTADAVVKFTYNQVDIQSRVNRLCTPMINAEITVLVVRRSLTEATILRCQRSRHWIINKKYLQINIIHIPHVFIL